MTRETSKKLIDARWPVPAVNVLLKEGMEALCWECGTDSTEKRIGLCSVCVVAQTSLGELVRACGESFGELRFSSLAYTDPKRWKTCNRGLPFLETEAEQPEDSVALFWIKIENLKKGIT